MYVCGRYLSFNEWNYMASSQERYRLDKFFMELTMFVGEMATSYTQASNLRLSGVYWMGWG